MFITPAIAADAATETAEASGAFPPFDPTYMASQLFWLAITFGILYYVMSKVALPRIAGILEDRSMRIAQDLDEANRLKAETDEVIAAYEQELADARAKGNKIANSAKDEAAEAAAKKRADVEAGLDARLAEAETKIAGIRSQALGEVDTIAAETAETIVKSLVGGTVTKAEIKAALKDA
jgi:F-type H+-transporting ATPase subunit b